MTARRGLVVVVCDDEPMIVDAIGLVIRSAGHTVRGASTPSEVRALFEPAVWEDVDAVLCDLAMPEIGGDAVLAFVATVAPHVRRVVLTGADVRAVPHDVQAHAILEKPAGLDRILAELERVDGAG